MPMLEVDHIHSYYGNIHALKGISLTVEKGEIVTLIGGNGAGKTTTLRTITGTLKPREGTVRLEGEDLLQTTAARMRRPSTSAASTSIARTVSITFSTPRAFTSSNSRRARTITKCSRNTRRRSTTS